MDRVIGPVVKIDDGQMRAVADDELDVLGIRAGALLIDDHDGFGEGLETDLQMPECELTHAGTLDHNCDRVCRRDLFADRDHGRLRE
jgi:hypothetical protein